MAILAVVGAVLAAWCVLPFPLAVAVGRSFRAGALDDRAPERVSSLPNAG